VTDFFLPAPKQRNLFIKAKIKKKAQYSLPHPVFLDLGSRRIKHCIFGGYSLFLPAHRPAYACNTTSLIYWGYQENRFKYLAPLPSFICYCLGSVATK